MNFDEETTELATADQNADLPSSDTSTEPVAHDDFATELDPLAGASSRRKVGSGPVLIVAVILIAVAGLFSMRKIAEVTAASGIDSEIEATIVKFLESIGEPGGGTPAPRSGVDYESLLGVITESYSDRQVPLQDVQRDPFVIETAAGGKPVDPSVDPNVEAAEKRARRREAKHVELKNPIREKHQRLTKGRLLSSHKAEAWFLARMARDVLAGKWSYQQNPTTPILAPWRIITEAA